jgi:hypothetical protein
VVGPRGHWLCFAEGLPIIAKILPNPAIIPKPGKVAGMIWITKSFQILLESALIAEIKVMVADSIDHSSEYHPTKLS